jgi:nucleoside-diphosphate-sugar epimerase
MMRILVTGGSGFIGTNLMDTLISDGQAAVRNVDIAMPFKNSHVPFWKKTNILEKNSLTATFRDFCPDIVIHLAARTDIGGRTLGDYRVNTQGTQNLVDIVGASPMVQRLIVTSTQFVHQYKGVPLGDTDFAPHTVYGESKVITEQVTRQAALACAWSIIRPTNIWGPWHPRYPAEFWKTLRKGFYLHPGRTPVKRSYGYVGNVVWQILKILELPSEQVDQKVFYVGDEPINLLDWVNGFSRNQLGRNVRIVPSNLVKLLAFGGDVLKMMGIEFPVTTSRYKSMTTSNEAPMQRTFDVLGRGPYTLDQGIIETVRWMREFFPDLVKVPPQRMAEQELR